MFEPENDFERRLVEAALQPASRRAFVGSLLKETVHLALFPDERGMQLLAGLDPEQGGVLPEGVTMNMRMANVEGVACVPMFTSPGRIWEFTRDTHVATSDTIEAVFRRYPGMGFVLNPYAEYGKHFLPAEAEALLAGAVPAMKAVVVPEGSRVLVGVPAQNTTDIRMALTAHFSRFDDVSSAYLSIVSIGGQAPNLLVEVVVADPAKADREALAAPLLQLARPERMIDFTIRDTAKSVIAFGSVPPFYVSKKRSLLSRLFRR